MADAYDPNLKSAPCDHPEFASLYPERRGLKPTFGLMDVGAGKDNCIVKSICEVRISSGKCISVGFHFYVSGVRGQPGVQVPDDPQRAGSAGERGLQD